MIDPGKNIFAATRELGESLIKKEKMEQIKDTSIELDIKSAEERLKDAALNENEEEYIRTKEEIRVLKNRAEMFRIRKENKRTIITDEQIRDIFAPVEAATETENKRLLKELADALERVDEICKAGRVNIDRYNSLVMFWESHVLHRTEFLYRPKLGTDFGMNHSFKINLLREKANG
ncbi:MAG: hypothetical protein IKO25_09215 [Clostridia bacterium]|nr:hypothetical protein [Clostridia bacterium]